MTLNPQALTEAARALCKCEYPDMADSWHDIAAPDFAESATLVITTYLSALPPISEGIVERLRELSPSIDEIYRNIEYLSAMLEKRAPNEITGTDIGQALLEAANTIERLSRELDARGGE